MGTKTLALLGFLALEPGDHQREQLTTLLWSEYPEERAKASLRQALTRLRGVVGDALHADRTTVRLTGPFTSDVGDFLRLEADDPAAALKIDVTQFLSALPVRNAPLFEEWVDEKRRDLARRYLRLLAGCTRDAMARRDWRMATALAAQWREHDAESDDAVAALIESTYLAGDASAALEAHARHLDRRDADRAPTRKLTDLVERIQRETAAKRPAPSRASDTWHLDRPEFTSSLAGRAGEWERLRHAWNGLASGTSGIVLLDGEAGAGKTRLADDFSRWVTSHGGVVLRGRCYDVRAGAPFGPIIDVLHSSINAPGLAGVDAEWLAEVARVVPELRAQFPGLAASRAVGSADAWRLLEALAQVMTAIAEESPVLVVIDDLQWCDADSSGALQSVVRRLAPAAPILWCCTYTTGSVDRDAPGAHLHRVLRGMPGAVSISLAPLGEDDVWHMIRELGKVDAPTGGRRLAARVHEVTAGNPFYVVELLKTMFARSLLAVDPDTGRWIVQPSALTAAGDAFALTVHETIAERIECLPDELRAVLITVAVSGPGVGTDALSNAHGISRLRAASWCDALAERLLLVEVAEELYQCAHPIVAHVVRQGLSRSRRAEVHRALALSLELVEQREGTGRHVAAIARHAEQAGERAIAYRYALRAFEAACDAHLYDEALSWIGTAAGAASTTEEIEALNGVKARVVASAGWQETPPIHARVSLPLTRVDEGDFDLPARA